MIKNGMHVQFARRRVEEWRLHTSQHHHTSEDAYNKGCCCCWCCCWWSQTVD